MDVYTDGSFKNGRGSWSYLVVAAGRVLREQSGQARKTDSNRMEFQAAIEALQSFSEGSCLRVFTDSRVLLECIPNLNSWSEKGWLNRNQRPIPNQDLMKILLFLLVRRTVEWNWVKAHSGNPFNERCDELCLIERLNLKSTMREIL